MTNRMVLAQLTTNIVAAYVQENSMAASEVAGLIRSVHSAMAKLDGGGTEASAVQARLTPAQIRKSTTSEALMSFEDGRPYRLLKRHLTTRGMTPSDYRAKWGLPADYPMTAPAYSKSRSEVAKRSGLGSKGKRRSTAEA